MLKSESISLILSSGEIWNPRKRIKTRSGGLSEQVGVDDPVPYDAAFTMCVWFGLICIVTVPYLREYSNRPRHSHGDACRCPRYSSLLRAVLGVGIQQLIT